MTDSLRSELRLYTYLFVTQEHENKNVGEKHISFVWGFWSGDRERDDLLGNTCQLSLHSLTKGSQWPKQTPPRITAFNSADCCPAGLL